MTVNVRPAPHGLRLTAISGANPLGFLAALGTLAVARRSGYPEARLGWERSVSWIPMLDCGSSADPETLCQSLATSMCGKQISTDAKEKRKAAQRSFDASKKALDDKEKEIKKRRLRGQDQKAAVEAEIMPLKDALSEKRKGLLEALKNAVPRAELALDKGINFTVEEYRNNAFDFLEEASHDNRETVDFLAAFGCDVPADKLERISTTRFCFITGSGQQFFLNTVCQLIDLVSPERIKAALFEPWTYSDEKYSLRWDPLEDRRYALMDRNPADLDSRTVWMANLLAYHSLVLFSSAPTSRGLSTTAWTLINEEHAFTWPIWSHPSGPDSIRSLLQLKELSATSPDRSQLVERGVVAAYRASRIKVGSRSQYKVNFSPARSLFAQHLG